jgi:signal transduction histidine kinase
VELDNVLFEVYRQVSRIEKPVAVELTAVDQATILGDEDRLKQLALNLVDNGIKYTPPGGVVKLSLSQDSQWAQITVSDTGVGIPAEDIPHIFERFYRVDKARSRAQGGSGLGLAIAKWVAQAHGGNIQVDSVVGQGTTFRVNLPLYKVSRNGVGPGAETESAEMKTRPGKMPRAIPGTLRRGQQASEKEKS